MPQVPSLLSRRRRGVCSHIHTRLWLDPNATKRLLGSFSFARNAGTGTQPLGIDFDACVTGHGNDPPKKNKKGRSLSEQS